MYRTIDVLARAAKHAGPRGEGFARAGGEAGRTETRDAKRRVARKYAPGTMVFANSTNLPSPFANLLEKVFSDFAKNSNLPSAFGKHLELL
jgi:hypothetical protein